MSISNETIAANSAKYIKVNTEGTDVEFVAGTEGGTGGTFVDRGNVTAYDWTQATLTLNDTWVDLDCSSIVPAGAKAILFSLIVLHVSAAGKWMRIKKNGNANDINLGEVRLQVGGVAAVNDITVSCDANRICKYRSNYAFTTVNLVIRGWWT